MLRKVDRKRGNELQVTGSLRRSQFTMFIEIASGDEANILGTWVRRTILYESTQLNDRFRTSDIWYWIPSFCLRSPHRYLGMHPKLWQMRVAACLSRLLAVQHQQWIQAYRFWRYVVFLSVAVVAFSRICRSNYHQNRAPSFYWLLSHRINAYMRWGLGSVSLLQQTNGEMLSKHKQRSECCAPLIPTTEV